MSRYRLTTYCNGSMTCLFEDNTKKGIKRIKNQFYLDPTAIDIDEDALVRYYLASTPPSFLDDEDTSYFEYRIEDHKINKKDDVLINSTISPWTITRKNNGELVLSNCVTSKEIPIQSTKKVSV